MSKKTQKNQPEKKEIQIVDQQKDPMLRALQKKVRNMNKKLNQIAQLSAKKDLKPEQEQKISKKDQVVQEKQKYIQMIEVYKQIAGESEKVIRKMQLSQLEDIAQIIASREYAVDLGFLFNQNVDNLVRVLTTPTSNDLTFKERVDQISRALIDAANNTKLKKSLKQYLSQNSQKKRSAPQAISNISNKEQPISVESDHQRQKQIQNLQAEQKEKKEKKQPLQTAVTVPILIQGAPAPITIQPKDAPQASEASKIPVQQQKAVAQVPTPTQAEVRRQEKVQSTPNQAQGSKNADVRAQPNQEVENKDNRENRQQRRGYRGYKNDGRPGRNNGKYSNDQKRPYKKPTFKPKYDQPKQAQQKNDDSSLQQSDDQPKARQFKRQEVRQLIEDGFIVVGKPKQKTKDQRQYHDRQHGKKHHHHQSKKNY